MKSKIVIGLLAVALLAMGYFYWNERSDRVDLENTIKSSKGVQLPEEVKHIADIVDEKGVQTAIYGEVSKISEGQFQAVLNENDSLKKKVSEQSNLLGIATNQITAYQSVNSTLEAYNLIASKAIDSLGRRIYNYSDDNLSLTFRPDADTLNNAGYFNFKYNANLSITQYWDRKWLLGAKKSKIAITSHDPRITINGYKKYDITQKDPHFGLRVQGSGLINPSTGSYGIGPAARIDFDRFSLQYQHLYFPESQRWRPTINLNYDIIRF